MIHTLWVMDHFLSMCSYISVDLIHKCNHRMKFLADKKHIFSHLATILYQYSCILQVLYSIPKQKRKLRKDRGIQLFI